MVCLHTSYKTGLKVLRYILRGADRPILDGFHGLLLNPTHTSTDLRHQLHRATFGSSVDTYKTLLIDLAPLSLSNDLHLLCQPYF